MNNKKNPDQKPEMPPSSSSPKKQTLFISSLILLWYTSNIGVLLLNKFLLSNYGFKFPIFLTMCHMSACAILSYVSIVFLKLVPLQHLKSRSQFMKVATLSIVFCASVVGGNVSLRYLPVSFNQAVGATTPFFTALFAYLMTFKREAWVTYGALVPVVTGVVIASGGEPGFHWFGFIMCISATAARAFKSVLQGILLSSEGEKLNSMNLMLYMSPIAVIALLPVTIVMEPDVMSVTLSLARQHQYMWILLLVNSVMAYSANLLNFLVTKHTSALTLQVLGNAKGAVAVVISILLFRNPVTVMGIGGYSITVLGFNLSFFVVHLPQNPQTEKLFICVRFSETKFLFTNSSRIMHEKNIVEDVINDFVDNFTETVQKKKNVSFFEQDDTVSSRFNRMFGREKPIHHVLGGGKSADVLLWRNKKISASVLMGATAIWVLFEWINFHFLSLVCYGLLLGMIVQFVWSNASGALNRSSQSGVPRLVLPKDFFADVGVTVGTEVNRGLMFLQDLACRGSLKQFLMAAIGLWLAAMIGSCCNFLTVLYIGFVGAHTMPVLYERYEDEVDGFVDSLLMKFHSHYKKMDTGFLSRIPSGRFGFKKRD
ncbi:hypothetical protein HID58_044494 [Brassica napus]|uniref:Reticulon-like protein n=2 Tax=Brassica napus TaxID=3708 RepID=A0ABQ8BJH2_BRANA|nr:hypothetical protein HID58_044494 [Brassica napus]